MGVAILATNLRQNLDDAAFLCGGSPSRSSFRFRTRRSSALSRIWTEIWPPQTPLAPDVDLKWLAARFMLSGGNIRKPLDTGDGLACNADGPPEPHSAGSAAGRP